MKQEFALERYKYVLDQKKKLNDATFKVAAFYQAVLLLISGGQFRLIEKATTHQITNELAKLGSWGLAAMTLLLSIACVAALISGVVSWVGYRQEEAATEAEHLAKARPLPTFWDAYRWYETYIILTIILVAFSYAAALRWVVLPLFD